MDEPLVVHNDPDITPGQAKLGELTAELKDALTAQGYPVSEAHAKISDFKVAVMERLWEDLKPKDGHTPKELRRWWNAGKRLAWLTGYDVAIDKVWRTMMRQESWSRMLRKVADDG